MRLRMYEFCSMHIHTLIARTRCGVKQISVFVYAALKYVCRAVIGCKGYNPVVAVSVSWPGWFGSVCGSKVERVRMKI